MRRVVLLALLALALPTAMSAGSVSFSANSTSNLNGIGIAPDECNAVVAGVQWTISFNAPQCTPLSIGGLNFTFTSGTLMVQESSTGALVFQDAIANGSASIADTADGFPQTADGTLEDGGDFSFLFPSLQASIPDTANVSGIPVPEPTALDGLMLGTGLLGLAEMARRKLKLVT